ncbi:hypothetical protein [Nocardia sp. NRRL S-836]|uniref:hypothetical protein n=1 Tax=Nocardia sp. NRRL S-836 TaxID=1519492 RepID=UPI0006ADD669|nr:hypothetical protein [Nocardia sp. NRRL S-836]KOV84637.1 hypothetical protein ADL03_15190 [Nocardia sp. NRRL S-836]
MSSTIPFPPCPDCEGPLKLRFDTTYVYCLNTTCEFDGINAGEVVGDHGQPDRGLPRPLIKGRPVPWIAPVIGDQVAWKALNAVRFRSAERHWLCQYCGDALDSAPTAWVAVAQDEVAAGGGLHQNCMELARAECPALRHDPCFVFAEVRPEDRAHDWSAVIERLMAYEQLHDQVPNIVPLLV